MGNPDKPVRTSRSSAVSFNPTTLLTVRVGEESCQEDFTVHESFLTSRSEFFRRAMNGTWEEAESRIINLPDDKPEIFALYLNLVYTGHLPNMRKTNKERSALTTEEFGEVLNSEYDDVIRLYILADKLQDRAARNAAITAIVDTAPFRGQDEDRIVPSASQVRLAYQHTPEGSNLRKLMTDFWSEVPSEYIFKWASELPKDLLRDLAVILRQQTKPTRNVAKRNGGAAYLETL